MNKLILLFSIFFIAKVNAQDNSLSRYIEWDKNFFDSQERLSFKNAIYPDTFSNLPYYFEQIELPFSAEIKVNEIVFQKLENNENINTSLVPDTLNISVYSSLSRKKNVTSIKFLPLYKSKANDSLYVVKSFSVVVKRIGVSKSSAVSKQYSNHSVLSSGKWYKIKLKENGIYKISYSQLKEMGFSNPSNVHLYGNGGAMLPKSILNPTIDDLSENAVVHIEKGNDSYILFYGEGPDVWNYNKSNKHFFHTVNAYSEYSYYFLTENQSEGKQVVLSSEPGNSNLTVSRFDDYKFHEIDKINILASGATWLGEGFSPGTTIDLTFLFPNIVTSENAFLYYSLAAASSNDSYFDIVLGNKKFTSTKIAKIYRNFVDGAKAEEASGQINFVPQGETIKVSLNYPANSDNISEGYLNYIGLNVKRNLELNQDQLLFRSISSVEEGNVTTFKISVPTKEVEIWDITNVCNAKKMSATYSTDGFVSFTAATDSLRQFIIFKTNTGFLSPTLKDDIGDVGKIKNQDIHGEEIPDLIIVSPSDTGILHQAQRLADFRITNDKLKVLTLTTDEIYNEFSSGKCDITAIRNMVKMFYDRSNSSDMPKYLLLFGDGTYDNKTVYNPEKNNNTNLVPTYQSENSLVKSDTYTSDDFYGWLDDTLQDQNNLLDIGIGRLPVKDRYDAETVVNKIINYSSSKTLGPWRNVITIIGDDTGDQDPINTHVEYSDELADFINNEYPPYITQKIYIDAYQNITTSVGQKSPDAENAINDRIANGTLVLNYTGHGSPNQLTHQAVINKESIGTWQNYDKLFVFFTATCEFSRFDDVDIIDGKYQEKSSGGEKVILSPDGGGIALFSASRVVYGPNNQTLNENFYKTIFSKDNNGKYYRLGDVMRIIKNEYPGDYNKLKFVLIGDPSVMLNFPKGKGIITDSINGHFIDRNVPVNDTIAVSLSADSICVDTLRALSIGRISGHIEDDNGNFNSSFNGTVYPIIFDKEDSRTTLGGPGQTPFPYRTRENIIFKGMARVKDGLFSFEFPVPKDIKYYTDRGKIVYYANNESNDLAGYNYNFRVGGINKNAELDESGPKIKVYMNDTNFISGGITDNNPQLLVKLSDLNGINATGAGIGHDITAVMDDDYSSIFSLNNSYQTDMDDFRNGTATFQLHDLLPGKHVIKVVAWDVYNNSTKGDITFNVVESNNIIIKNVNNYPNPFAEATSFVFEHNWAGENLTIEIKIYSFSGQLVNILKEKEYAVGYRSNPIVWDGTNSTGQKVSAGMYLYKILVNTKDGKHADGYGKLLLVRSK